MELFISFHGKKSQAIAKHIADWLPCIITSVDPWTSFEMEKGITWIRELKDKLESLNFGIICLTQDNLTSEWIHFESGAIGNNKNSRTYTLLTELKSSNVKPPLSIFQHTSSNDKEDMLKLVGSINNKCKELGESSLSENNLIKSFNKWWGEFEEGMVSILKSYEHIENLERSDKDILLEILSSVRNNEQIARFPSDPLQGFPGVTSSSIYVPRRGLLGDIEHSDIFKPKNKMKNEEPELEENKESDINGEHLEK